MDTTAAMLSSGKRPLKEPYRLRRSEAKRLQRMDVVERKIESINVQTLSPEEKQSFIIAIGNMKRTLGTVLTAVTQPPVLFSVDCVVIAKNLQWLNFS
jgi:hypothetical protein